MRIKIGKLVAAVFAVVLMAQGASAASVNPNGVSVVVHDDFSERLNRSTIGNGWNELEAKRSFVTVRSRKANLKGARKGRRGADAAIATSGHNMSRFDSFEISFNWRAMKKNERSDRIYVSYTTDADASMTDPSAWTTLFRGSDKGRKKKKKQRTRSFSGIFDFTGEDFANGLENVRFMIWTDVSEGKKGKKEGFLFDNFLVTGRPDGIPFEPFFDDQGEPVQPLLAANALVDSPAPVPLPASALMLLAGLTGFGCMARRRKV